MSEANSAAPQPSSNPLIERIHAGVAGRHPHAIGYREALAMLAIHREGVPGIEEAIDFAIEQYREVHGDPAEQEIG